MTKLRDEEFMQLFNERGAIYISQTYGVTERGVYKRRRNLERRYGAAINAPTEDAKLNFPGCVNLEIKNGTVLVGSDFHVWPGDASICFRAFKKFTDDIKPDAVILNGDVTDFPRLSAHPQTWESAPDAIEEIEAIQDHLHDIEQRCKKGAHKIWTLGNHDARFERIIANALPQMKGIKGVHLADHFAIWTKAMSCMVNYGTESGRTMIKHRLKGGKHATYNNVKEAGTHIITGHLHSQNIRSVSDYRGFDLYGVDTGCVADREHRAFSYTENAPTDWRSGFALLTYRDGELMVPELITRWRDNKVQFRGEIISV